MIHLSIDDAVATLTLMRPEKRNALTSAMLLELDEHAREVSAMTSIRVVVIRGAGEHFCVGADLDDLKASSQKSLLDRRQEAELGGRMLRSVREIPQPTMAVVQGVATGGGACIATACDFRIACESARIGYGEVNMAMNLMWQALPLCVALVGPARAKRLIMSGQLFAAPVLERWGLIDEVTSAEELETTVSEWVQHYSGLAPVAAQMIKRSINRYSGALAESIMHADADQWLLTAQSDDFEEAVGAFLEKRQPAFTGD